MSGKEIVVYTMTGCQHCAGVKEYLAEKGIEFTERNVLEDDEAMADFRELGFRGTPVTLIGEEAIVGFDRAKFDELLSGLEDGS
jgi:glutaredoxin-like protein NrdH